MSFSFGFDLEDAEDVDLAFSTSSLSLKDKPEEAAASTSGIAHAEVPLEELLLTLPPLISYTPVLIPLSSSTASDKSTTVYRRDLFDARFQVLNQGSEIDDDADEDGKGKEKDIFIDESSDLVKGIYEGGLKTWECSLDLIDCLDGLGYGEDGGEKRVAGKSVLELGCGTALPTCAIFYRLLCELKDRPANESDRPITRIHLQDYNKQVLSLITLPNILLAYVRFLLQQDSPSFEATATLPSATTPGELELTPELLDSFELFLKDERIDLRFFEGDWGGMKVSTPYDLVLTSETVYSVSSLPPLLSLLQASSGSTTQCLVACKRIYFGVGGGELEFRRQVEERGGEVETVWGMGEGEGRSKGVGRVVMSVKW